MEYSDQKTPEWRMLGNVAWREVGEYGYFEMKQLEKELKERV